AYDASNVHPDDEEHKMIQAFYEFMVPKGQDYSTEMGLEVTSLGVQVHGGMGFIEETGAAQYYRDARILTIYEGTTAIQANDLVGRKTARDGGAVARALIARVRETEAQLTARGGTELTAIATRLSAGSAALEAAVDFVVRGMQADVRAGCAGSVPYLKLAGVVLSGWQMARAALAADKMLKAGEGDAQFLAAKIATAHFHADHILSQAGALRSAAVDGAPGVLAMPESAF